jgi:hypothetical protein
MSECSSCHAEQADVEMRLGRMSCLKCTQDRYARALSNYVVAMSKEVCRGNGWSILCEVRN